MSYQERYTAYQEAIETYLNTIFSAEDKPYGKLQESIRYSLLAGGKRIRPVLTLEFARLGGIDWHLALPYACALELVHNYSLIHDDLPCMDDDDLRRGKPTNHKVYGETLAVLAGDAMQPEAFRIILQARGLSAENRIEAALILARACGADGMVAGQVLDTLCHVRDEKGLSTLNRLKTGVMISAAAELGCVASKMPMFWMICWMSWGMRACSASPSARTRTRARSHTSISRGWTAVPKRSRNAPSPPRKPSGTFLTMNFFGSWQTAWWAGASNGKSKQYLPHLREVLF